MSETESVRISKDLKASVAEMAEKIRPRATTQSVIEHAIEVYLQTDGKEIMLAAEERVEYKTKNKKKERKG